MQSAAPRVLRTSLLRQAPRAHQLSSSPYATASTSFSPYQSSHPAWAPSPSSSSSTYTPSLRFPTSHVRSFSSSAPAPAREADQNPFEDPKFHEHAPLFERIQQSPEVLAAIEHMAKLTAEKTGVDLAAGHKPSLSMMMSLARDPDLRAAAERLMAALRSAGVEVDPKQAFQALQMMGGEGFEQLKNGLDGYHEKARRGDEGDDEGGKK
ncbi:uncharacterized protein JCM10292_003123 [Rhodotorula paludigena]|uniref:uncharacterized protein n=1 Tax=Rhodotorula paludigena TaxID=86838 RepID=UPI0031770BB7